jgi:hypothetical protein
MSASGFTDTSSVAGLHTGLAPKRGENAVWQTYRVEIVYWPNPVLGMRGLPPWSH